MSVATFKKDPDATLDYTLDWSQWLPTGDTIVELDEVVVSDGEARSLAVKQTSGRISIAGPNAPANDEGTQKQDGKSRPSLIERPALSLIRLF